jgi:hypothetical protein
MGVIQPRRVASTVIPPASTVIDPSAPQPPAAPGAAGPSGVPIEAMREPEPGRTMHHGGFGSRLKDGLVTFLRGLSMPQQSTGDSRQDFFNRLGAGAGGFGVGVVNPQLAHDIRYREDLAKYDERQNRENEIARRDLASAKIESDIADAATERQWKRAQIVNQQHTQKTADEKLDIDKRAQQNAEGERVYKRREDAVKGDAVRTPGVGDFWFSKNKGLGVQVAPGEVYRYPSPDQADKRKADLDLEKTRQHTEEEIRKQRALSPLRIREAEQKAQIAARYNRTGEAKIWNDKKAFETQKQDLHEARSRVSQLQSVVKALENGDTSSNSSYAPEIQAILGSNDPAEVKAANARAALEKARSDESALKTRLSTFMDDKAREHGATWKARWDGEWPAVDIGESSNFTPTRAATGAAGATDKVFPASKIARAAKEAKMSVHDFRTKLAKDGVTVDEDQ